MKERKHEAPPRYDAAFKEGAIRLVTEEGRCPHTRFDRQKRI